MEIKKLTNADAGCIYDSHNGHYNIPFVIGYAEQAGRPTDPFVQWALNCYASHCHMPAFPNEALIEECDAAIVWLNDNVADECDLYFDFNDGDFGAYFEDDWEDPEEFAQSAKKGDD